jgi:hypothetical protein
MAFGPQVMAAAILLRRRTRAVEMTVKSTWRTSTRDDVRAAFKADLLERRPPSPGLAGQSGAAAAIFWRLLFCSTWKAAGQGRPHGFRGISCKIGIWIFPEKDGGGVEKNLYCTRLPEVASPSRLQVKMETK